VAWAFSFTLCASSLITADVRRGADQLGGLVMSRAGAPPLSRLARGPGRPTTDHEFLGVRLPKETTEMSINGGRLWGVAVGSGAGHDRGP